MDRPLKILAVVAALGQGAFGVSTLGAQAPAVASRTTVRPDPDRTVARAMPRGTTASLSRPTEHARSSEERGTRRERRGRRGESFEALGLSHNQQAQIDAIRESSREQMRELRTTGRTGATRGEWHAIREESNALIDDVLTPAQRHARETSRTERATARQNRRIERMGEQLGLGAEQSARVRSIMEQSAIDRAAAARNGEDRQAATSAVREATRAAMLNVLTPDQQAQMEEMRTSRSERRRGSDRRGSEARGGESPRVEPPAEARVDGRVAHPETL